MRHANRQLAAALTLGALRAADPHSLAQNAPATLADTHAGDVDRSSQISIRIAVGQLQALGARLRTMSKGVGTFDEAGLLSRVRGTDYGDAIAYCEDALEIGAPARYWRRQLAYCLFLDERGPIANQWERAPAVFEELVRDEPEDPDLLFWRGYLLKVALAGFDELGLTELRRAFDLDPTHPYVNLVLAAYEGPREAIPFLQRTLSSQPRNFRAVRYLASRYAAIGRTDDARQLLSLILRGPPFVDDTGPLILREYVNSVLTGAYWAEQSKVEVRQMLANDDRQAMIEG